MAIGVDIVIESILDVYDSFLNTLPAWAQDFTNLFLLVLTVLIYSAAIWNFYRLLSKKNIFHLDLHKYNKAGYPLGTKMLGGLLYFLEYIIVLPVVIFFWFAVLTIALLLLAEGSLEVQRILFVAAVVVASVRMTSYYHEDLSKEIAKLLPFTLLAVAILTPGFFDFNRVIGNFSQLPVFFDNVFIYFIFIIGLEVLLRFFDFIFSLFGTDEETEDAEEEEKPRKKKI